MAQPDYRFKVILLGDMDVGKTSIILRFTDGTFTEDSHSDCDHKQKDITLEGGKVARVLITDTAGQERFRTLTSSYYRNADAIIVCYAVDDKTTFENIEGHVQEATRYSTRSEKFLVANKQDVEDQVVSDEEGTELAEKLRVSFHKTSAKSGEGIEQLFLHVATKLMASGTVISHNNEVVDLTAKPTKKPASGRCLI